MNFRNAREVPDVRIEMTPLIDVVFQLLIFFLLTSSFIADRALDIELPETSDAPTATRDERVVVVSIGRDGSLSHDGEPVDLTRLAVLFRRAAAATEETSVILRGDHAVSHGRVVEVMDLARAQGVTQIGIATAPKDADENPLPE